MNRLKKKATDTTATISKHETRFKSVEESLTDAEEGIYGKVVKITYFFLDRRTLEARLASAKQLINSHEEVLRQRDEERRLLKSKVISTELQARGKEAQIRHQNVTDDQILI